MARKPKVTTIKLDLNNPGHAKLFEEALKARIVKVAPTEKPKPQKPR